MISTIQITIKKERHDRSTTRFNSAGCTVCAAAAPLIRASLRNGAVVGGRRYQGAPQICFAAALPSGAICTAVTSRASSLTVDSCNGAMMAQVSAPEKGYDVRANFHENEIR